MSNRTARAAFTLVEVLVVIAIIVLLLSVLLPSLQGARDSGRRAKCLSNLRESARLAQYNAHEDSRGRLHTPHPAIREENRAAGDPPPYWLGRGDHEWGGADGELPEYNLTGVAGNPGKDSARRFLNRFLYGVRGGQTTGVGPEARRNDWQIFQETGEDSPFGRADAVNMSMRPRDRLFETSVFRATGNS